MSVENSPEQWHDRIQNFCRKGNKVINEARSLEKSRFFPSEEKEKLALAAVTHFLEGRMKFLQDKGKSLSNKKVIDLNENEYLTNILEGGDRQIKEIQELMQSILLGREKKAQETLKAEINAQKKEVEELHHHIQHLCQVSQDLVHTMNDLREDLHVHELTAKQKEMGVRAEEHRTALQELDRTICLEKRVSSQNKKAITALLQQCQQNLNEIGRMINPFLHRKYTSQRQELERQERVEWRAPRSASAEQRARQEYDRLWQQAREQWEKREDIDDAFFEQLKAYRKQITGLFSSADNAPSPEMLQWHINYSLFKNDYERAIAEGNREMRQKLGFLILQYLAKMALPGKVREGPEANRGLNFGSVYHRNHLGGAVYYHVQIALFQKLTPGLIDKPDRINERLFLLDHPKASDLLQLKYHLIEKENIEAILPDSKEEMALVQKWSASIENAVANALAFTPPFSFSLKKKLIFNFTQSLERDLECTKEDKEQKASLLKAKLDRIEQLLDKAILDVAVALVYERPNQYLEHYMNMGLLDERHVAHFIKGNCLAIALGSTDHISYMVQLPLLQHRLNPRLPIPPALEVSQSEWLGNFIQDSGLKIGALRLTYHVFDIDMREDLLTNLLQFPVIREVEYAPRGKKTIIYYPNIQDLLQLRLLAQLRKTAAAYQETAPQIALPAQAIRVLFIGIINEISSQLRREEEDGPIHKLYNSPIVQSTLYRFIQHLAMANQFAYDTTEFTNAIELAHAEMMTLITLFQPYNSGDFSRIFAENVRHIPQMLRENVKVGIGTSAMSVFTCVNASVAESISGRVPEKVVSLGVYYEEENLLGANRLAQVLENEQVTQVDLYVTQINHGLIPNQAHTHYVPTQVIAEVGEIFGKKAGTQRLTVAIDCTIDYIQSSQVRNILEHFSQQIAEGRLNFVFFGSGQKYAMLGQDNYYGAPFYVVNNGDEHWAPFKRLVTEERFHTDPISQQWFCLSTQYALPSLDAYREILFKNTREALNQLESYSAQEQRFIIVSTVDVEMLPSFIDIKFSNENVPEAKKEMVREAGGYLLRELEKIFKRDRQILDRRGSFGFTHTNINFIDHAVRITLGLDPKDIDRVIEAISNVEKILE